MGLVKYENHFKVEDGEYIVIVDDGDGTEDVFDGYDVDVIYEDEDELMGVFSFTIPYKYVNHDREIIDNFVSEVEEYLEKDIDNFMKDTFKIEEELEEKLKQLLDSCDIEEEYTDALYTGYNYVHDFWRKGTLSDLEDDVEIDVYTIQEKVDK